MYKPTEIEKKMMKYLKMLGIEKDTAIALLLSLEKEENYQQLINYIENNPKITKEDVLEKFL